MSSSIKKYLKNFSYLLFLVLISISILELCFRYQIIDFYKAELKGLNSEQELNSTKNNVLVFGDSFSAHPNSYVAFLRNAFPELNFINSSVPGTGIKQHQLLFKKRINHFNPKAIIYQFYVGNDFTDIKHPINYSENSFLKNIYWKLSENLLVLQYINFKLAFLNNKNQKIEKLQETQFSVDLYNNRVKSYFRSDPQALSNTILLKNKIYPVYKYWKTQLLTLSEITEDSIPIHLVLVPHNAQINDTYLKRNTKLGASIDASILVSEYPLLKKIKTDFRSWNIINPLEKFRELSNTDSLYYQNDPHLTLWGQQKLGEIVADQFNE